MAAPRSPNPYSSAATLEAAIQAAGSVDALASDLGVSSNVIRYRWCRELGVSPRSGKPSNQPHEVLSRLDADELGVLMATFSRQRLSVILGASESTIQKTARRIGASAVEHSAGPAAAMLRQRVKTLESEARHVNELVSSIEHASESLRPPPPLPRVRAVNAKRGARVDVVLHVSDMQYGQVVGGEVPGGSFSPMVFERERIPRYLEAVRGLLDNIGHPIGTVWIAQGGDFVEGHDVYKGQHWHLALDAGQQVTRLAAVWAPVVEDIACHAKALQAKRVAVVSVVGNHGVQGGRAAGAVPNTLNYDWICYQMIASALRDSEFVDFVDLEARKAIYFNAAGTTILLTHGDQDRGGGLVGVPVVTGMRNDLSVRIQTNLDHDVHLKGHYHRPTQITVGGDKQVYWSGDWVGANGLSVGRGGGSSPKQFMYIFHPEWGLHGVHPITLQNEQVEIPIVA